MDASVIAEGYLRTASRELVSALSCAQSPEQRFVPGACSTSYALEPGSYRSSRRTPPTAFLKFSGTSFSSILTGTGAKSNSSNDTNNHRKPFGSHDRHRKYGGGGLAGLQASSIWHLPFGKHKVRAESEKKRIMILMSDTGGGHRASAEALKAGFEKLYGDKYKVDYVDVWSNWTPYPFNELPKTYSFLVKNPAIWRMGYYVQQPRLVHYPTSAFTSVFVSRNVSRAFKLYQPDLVVSVHPLMQHVPLRALKDMIRRGDYKPVNFATVVTDLTTCHNTWFHPDVDRCFVPTEFARQRALKMGLKPSQVTVHGLPIRPDFSTPQQPKEALRKKLGMVKAKPAILLVGGGEGMGAIEKTVKAVAEKVGAKCQLVVVCGRNKKLVNTLSNRKYPDGMHVVVNGFVTNMAEWMSACDTIVTKAGPGTIAESLICGLPVLLNGFIPCQEAGNVPFVVDNKVGAFERNPAKIADQLALWLGPDNAEFKAMAKRAKEIGKVWQDALFRIVEDLAAMVSEEPSLESSKNGAGRSQASWELASVN